MKVAFLSYDFGEYCIRLASALNRDAEVMLVLPHQQATSHRSKLDQAVRFRPFHKARFRQPVQQLRTIYMILRWVWEFDPDVIHLQRGHLWFNLALPLLGRYPLVVTVHDPRHHLGDREGRRTPQAIMDFGYRRASQLIVHAAELRRVVLEELRLPEETIHVVPHIVLGDERAAKGPFEDEGVILFFGRIWEYKGLEYLIRAEPLISAQVPEAKFVIAGRGEDFDRYRRMMVHPERFVVYNEYVSDDLRAELFRSACVVVLPYVEASQSGVIPIAYTFSKPVVATQVGGLPEMVGHGETGYLVPPRDHRALAEAIVRLLRDRELRSQLGANGKLKIDAECSPEVVAQKTLEVYHRAVEAKRLATRQDKEG